MKTQLLLFLSFILATPLLNAQNNLREVVAVVRPVYDENTIKFFNDFSKSLRRDGYTTAADLMKSYAEGGFGTGFVYTTDTEGKSYLITNRHVVNQAETADIEFLISGKTTQKYSKCQIIITHNALDIAIIALPSDFEKKGLPFSEIQPTDGLEVFTAGFPGLGKDPSWQLGKGIISNSDIYIDELIEDSATTIIQHTAQVDAGSSGGPLLIPNPGSLYRYEVIGINTWKASNRENVNFAIPISALTEYVRNLSDYSNINSQEALRKRVNELLSEADINYKKTLPYISYNYISTLSITSFYELVNHSSKEAEADIKKNFQNGFPIEGGRIALADAISKNLSGNNTSISSIQNFNQNGLPVKVILNQGGKEVESEWIIEQGEWRMSKISNLNTRKLEKGIATTFGYKNSIRLGTGIILNNDQFSQVYNFTYGRTIKTFVTYELNVDWSKEYVLKDEYSYEDTTCVSKNGLGLSFGMGGQLPIKAGPFYVIPFLKGWAGIEFLSEGGYTYGFSTGIEAAYKLKERTYILLGAAYKRRLIKNPLDDVPYYGPLQTIDIHVGITF